LKASPGRFAWVKSLGGKDMVEKVKIPDSVKEKVKAAIEPLNKLEERVRETMKKAGSGKNVPPQELKKIMGDALKWIKGARTDVEKAVNEGVTWTISALNLPSRDDLVSIEKKVNRLAKDLGALEKQVGGKKPAKKPAKKVVKKATKKTVKKVVKKVAKKKPAVKKTK
jgi:polyhydroxyalkanoate synthesis regulator phasin